jgi:hypothetical protein
MQYIRTFIKHEILIFKSECVYSGLKRLSVQVYGKNRPTFEPPVRGNATVVLTT